MLRPNQKGFTSLETLCVCIMVGGLIGIAMPYYQKLALEAKEVTLRAELVNVRSGVELYHALQRHYPADLRNLILQKYLLPVNDRIISGDYLIAQSLDEDGNLLDPFGNRYRYDPATGQVASETKGYERW